jgi:peptide/nickel transport system substrate-binding protein
VKQRNDHGPSALWRLVALLATLALIAAACGGDDDDGAAPAAPEPQEETGDPVMGGEVVMGLEAETNSWLPGQGSFSNPGINVALSIYDPLMRRDEDGDVRPYLAESLEANDDLTEWTITLREGVEFHDGTPFDAEALKTIFDNYLRAEGSNLLGVLEDITELRVDGELTATYVLDDPNSAFPDILTGAAGWPFSPTAAAEFGEDATNNPVGTGPFVFGDWRRDDRLILTRNENYWLQDEQGNQLPYLDQITFRPIPDEDTRLASLRSGEVNAMHTLRQSIVRQIRETDGVNAYEYIGNNSGSSIINTAVAPTDDVRIRRALALALNQDDLIEVLGGTDITPRATQLFSPDDGYHSEDVADAWPDDDPEEAQRLLEEYMNDPDRSDGQSPGSPVQIDYNCPPDPSLIELAQTYQAFWQGIGFQVSLNQVEQATHIQNGLQGNYMMQCWRVGADEDPYTTLSGLFDPPEGNPTNFTNWSPPEVQDLLDQLRRETEFEARFDIVEQLSFLIAEEVPLTLTAYTGTSVAVHPSVRNVAGWKFPDGTRGAGTPGATVTWGWVWIDES